MQAGMTIPQTRTWDGQLQPLPVLVVSAVALLVVGVVMISSASMDMAEATLGNGYHYVIRQLLYAAMGCVAPLMHGHWT